MKKIKLFLASSAELKADREQFEIFIYRRCKAWFERGIFLHLELWEDFLDAMSPGGLQSEYNRVIKDCDIFVMLVHNKVGPYTAQEFGEAFGQFSKTNKPFIFTYFREPVTTEDAAALESLQTFETELKRLGHYRTRYENIEGLREHFGNQLDKLAAAGFMEVEPESAGQAVKMESKVKNNLGTINNIGSIERATFN
ncbi:MAG: hypothetical protein AB8B99_01165 [Phormidesmis sp.]